MDRDRPRASLGRPQGWDPVWQRPVPPSAGARLAPVGVFLVSLVAYLRTLMPGIAFDNWGEFQTVPAVLGIAHPTGYPTYILAARLFGILPIGSVAFRANLFSAVLAALALATLTWTATRLGVRPAVAAGGALAAGAVGTVWAAATVAGVDPLHLLLMALLLDRSLAWGDHGRPVDLALCGLLTGLALGNLMLTLAVAPFLALFALWAGRQTLVERPPLLFLPLLTLAAGLAVYLYLPLAARLDPPLPYNHPDTLDAFLTLVTGAQARGPGGPLGPDSLRTTLDALPALLGILAAQGALVLPAAGLVGTVILVVRRPALGLALVAILLVGAHVWANDQRQERDLLWPLLLLGLGSAVALEALARTGGSRLRGFAGRTAGPVAAAAGVVLAVAVASLALPAADRSHDRSGEDFAAAMTAQLPPNAAVFSFWSASTPLWHVQLVRGERPDLLVVDETAIAFEPGGTREDRMRTAVCQRPVYLLLADEEALATARQSFTLQPAFGVTVGVGSPSGTTPLTVYRVGASADTCP